MRAHRMMVAWCACAAVALAGGGPASAAGISPSAPVVHERFTLLPCSGRPAKRTTLQLEGCAEHRVVALDQVIDTLNARIFERIRSPAGRRAFTASNRNWVSFRDAACASEADDYAGGSIAPLIYAGCLGDLDRTHVTELHVVLRALSRTG